MVNPIRSAGLPADSITPRSKTHVFISTLSGGEKLGSFWCFLVSFHFVLCDASISRISRTTFQENVRVLRAKFSKSNKHAARRLRLFHRRLCELLHQLGESRIAAQRVPDGIQLQVAVSRLRGIAITCWLICQLI